MMELLLFNVHDIMMPFLYSNILLISVMVEGVLNIVSPLVATISIFDCTLLSGLDDVGEDDVVLLALIHLVPSQ